MKKYHEIKNFMNTEIGITVYSDEDQKIVNELIAQAYDKFDYIVKKYSRFSPTSELSIVNSQTTNPRIIDKEFYEIAKYCIDMYKLTEGAFDFTVIDLLEAIGYKNSYRVGEIDEPLGVDSIKELIKTRPNVNEIILTDGPEFTISLAKNQRIEFGGCLKGYAVDLAYEVLKPLKNFLIDAGGDIRASGNRNGILWNAGLWNGENPIEETMELSTGDALACSGSAARKFAGLHHLINPKSFDFEKKYSMCFLYINSREYTGELGPNLCMLADTFATSAFILGEEKIEKILPNGCYAIYR